MVAADQGGAVPDAAVGLIRQDFRQRFVDAATAIDG